jgi:hypothetical protein
MSATVATIRRSKKQQIADFFLANVGVKFASSEMHSRWGTAFRTRAGEITRDESFPIVIRNEVLVKGQQERSRYWSEWRAVNPQTEMAFPLEGNEHECNRA